MGTTLSELNKLSAKEKTYKIPLKPEEGEEQAEIKLMPLGVDDASLMDKFIEVSDESQIEGMMDVAYPLIAKCMGITKEELINAKISLPNLMDILTCVMESNKVDSTDKKSAAKVDDFIAKKRAQIAAKKEDANVKKGIDVEAELKQLGTGKPPE